MDRELLAFIEKCGTPGVMLTYEDLKKAGQRTLAGAVRNHLAVVKRLNLESASTAKPPGYWGNPDNMARELHLPLDEVL